MTVLKKKWKKPGNLTKRKNPIKRIVLIMKTKKDKTTKDNNLEMNKKILVFQINRSNSKITLLKQILATQILRNLFNLKAKKISVEEVLIKVLVDQNKI